MFLAYDVVMHELSRALRWAIVDPTRIEVILSGQKIMFHCPVALENAVRTRGPKLMN